VGKVWSTADITELCLPLAAASGPANGDEHQGSQSCEMPMLFVGELILSYLKINARKIEPCSSRVDVHYT